MKKVRAKQLNEGHQL